MTISTEESRKSYAGSDTVGPFPFPYYFLNDSDLVVILNSDDVGGGEQILTLNVDYTVAGAGDPAGGSVTTTEIVTSYPYQQITIYRDPARTQDTEYPEGDRFPAASHERALDKLTMMMQRIRDMANRCVRLPDGSSAFNMKLPSNRTSKYVAFDSLGNLTAVDGTTSDIIATPFMEGVLGSTNAPAAKVLLGATEMGRVEASSGSVVTISSAGAIPFDNTVPQSTEGTSVISTSITMQYSTDALCEFNAMVAVTAACKLVGCFFQSGSANGFGAFAQDFPAAGVYTISARGQGTVSGTKTVSVRMSVSSGTGYTNANTAGNAMFGGASKTRLTVTERL